ncbi:MAG: asparagine synthase (glutamine-hydrolyzing) [Tepidisphaeraceae bacterium]
MCGIAGVVTWDERLTVDESTLAGMAVRIAHRGPDGQAVRLFRRNAVTTGLVFRRLAVLDCDSRAMQPMSTPDGRYTLVFNGEIYNYRDLQKRLPGRPWQTTGDTEVLLAALAEWGPDVALERLDGMFALALWDDREQSLLLARDRTGQKPLYVSTGKGSLAFASELSALSPWPDWDRTIDDDALAHYLRYGYVLPPRTIYAGVRQIEPGTRVIVRPATWATADAKRWYTGLRGEPAPVTAHAAADTRTVIEKAVRRQLVSDVPLGVFLSGGIDSSVIAHCARRAGPVKTFSIGFDDARYDETTYAEAVAKHLGTEHRTFRVTPDVAADLPKLAGVFGEPFADSSALPTHWLSQQTRQHVTVALSGDGGDELFGGYDRYRAVRLPTGPLAPFASLGKRLERGHPKSRLTRAGRLLAAAGLAPAERYDRYVSLFDDIAVAALIGQTVDGERQQFFDSLIVTTGGPMEAALAFDRKTYLPGDLHTKVDRCSMLHSLEVRAPFMDGDVLELASRLRERDLMLGGPKRLLREAFAGELPAFVFKRKKTGFAVPIGDWFRTSLRGLLHDHLFAKDAFVNRFPQGLVRSLVADHEAEQHDHGQRLYALLMLELWWRQAAR